MRRSSRLAIFAVPILVLLGHACTAFAQTPKPEPTHRDVLLKHWTEIGEKVVKMAEEFPEEKYEYRPVPGVRTFADNLRHVAFWKAEYATKAAIVKALKSSLDEATALLKNGPAAPSAKLTDLWTAFIEHSGEHYGQLVVYFRLNGIVPPASRT